MSLKNRFRTIPPCKRGLILCNCAEKEVEGIYFLDDKEPIFIKKKSFSSPNPQPSNRVILRVIKHQRHKSEKDFVVDGSQKDSNECLYWAIQCVNF